MITVPVIYILRLNRLRKHVHVSDANEREVGDHDKAVALIDAHHTCCDIQYVSYQIIPTAKVTHPRFRIISSHSEARVVVNSAVNTVLMQSN